MLIDHRHRTGMTQIELASRIGKPQSFVSKYERFERRLDVIEFGRVLKALSRDPASTLTSLFSQKL